MSIKAGVSLLTTLVFENFSVFHWKSGSTVIVRMKVVILAVLSLVSLAFGAPRFQLGEEWELWKSEHGKSYQSQREELERHVIWQANRKYVEAHNQNVHILGFTLKMNHFGDMVSVIKY